MPESPDPIEQAMRYYHIAFVTVVYARCVVPSENQLILSVVEMVPRSFGVPPKQVKNQRLSGSSKWTIHIRQFPLDVADAIPFYQSHRYGEIKVPDARDRRDFVIHTHLLEEEPSWGFGFLESGAPFWGERPFWRRLAYQYRHHLFIASDQSIPRPWLESMQQEDHARRLSDFLLANLGIDLLTRPRFLGSAHMLLWNPILKDVRIRLAEGPSDTILLHFRLLPGMDVEGLSVLLREYRPLGPSHVSVHPVRTTHTQIRLGYEAYKIGFSVLHKDLGLIYEKEPLTFVRSVQMNIGIISGKKVVQVPPRRKRGVVTEYESSILGDTMRNNVVTPEPLPKALHSIIQEAFDHTTSNEAQRDGQRWFRNSEESASEFIRSLIRPARESLFIVDPYFAAREFRSFCLSAESQGVEIRVLTALQQADPEQDKQIELARTLQQEVKTTREKGLGLNAHIRVMQPSAIHDRFLKVDDRLWSLGSSFNAFGKAGTLLFRVRYADPIIEDLEQIWGTSESLDQYVQSRSP